MVRRERARPALAQDARSLRILVSEIMLQQTQVARD